MTIQELGNIGEFLGFLAILVTLFYLARQTKQNVELNRASEQRILIDQCNKYFRVTVEPGNLAAIRKGLKSYRALDSDEQSKAWIVFAQWINHYEQCIYAHRADLLPTPVSVAFEQLTIGFLVTSGGSEFWEDFGPRFGQDVREKINQDLVKPDVPAPAYETFHWLKQEGT